MQFAYQQQLQRNEELSAVLPSQLREVRRAAESLQESVLAEAALEIKRTKSTAENERSQRIMVEALLVQEREAYRENAARAGMAARELAKSELEARLSDGLREVRLEHEAARRAMQRQYNDLEARSNAAVGELRGLLEQRERELAGMENLIRIRVAGERAEMEARFESQQAALEARAGEVVGAAKASSASARALRSEVAGEVSGMRRKIVALELELQSTRMLCHDEVARTRASADATCGRLASQLTLTQQQLATAQMDLLPRGGLNLLDQGLFTRQQEELRKVREDNLRLREAAICRSGGDEPNIPRLANRLRGASSAAANASLSARAMLQGALGSMGDAQDVHISRHGSISIAPGASLGL